MKSRWSTFRSRVLLVFGSLAATLAMLEIGVRVMGLAPVGAGGDALQKVIKFDETLETCYVPNSQTVVRSQYGEFTTDYAFNELGLRDRPLPPRDQDESFRVLALGNSFVEGWGSSVDESFLSIAEKRVAAKVAKSRGVRLINGGASGYGAVQSYLFMKKLLPLVQPDAVVFFYVPTMISADHKFLRQAVKDAGGLATGLDVDVILKGGDGKAANTQTAEAPSPFVQTLARHSALVRLVAARLSNSSSRQQIVAGDPIKDLFAAYRASAERQADLHQETFRHMEAMKRLAEEKKLPFVVVYLPMPFEISASEWPRGREIYGIAEAPTAYRTPRTLAADSLKDMDLISAHEPLAVHAAQNADQRVFFPFDFHLNRDGQRIVGEWLGNELSERFPR